MIENVLEISVISYNRAEALRNTVKQLSGSPLRACKMRIFDNCSTDKTPRVCEEAASLLPHLSVVRHPKNLGASPNYLRAVELSARRFSWIMGNDGKLDFSDCQDVIDTIMSGKFDLISLGSMA